MPRVLLVTYMYTRRRDDTLPSSVKPINPTGLVGDKFCLGMNWACSHSTWPSWAVKGTLTGRKAKLDPGELPRAKAPLHQDHRALFMKKLLRAWPNAVISDLYNHPGRLAQSFSGWSSSPPRATPGYRSPETTPHCLLWALSLHSPSGSPDSSLMMMALGQACPFMRCLQWGLEWVLAGPCQLRQCARALLPTPPLSRHPLRQCLHNLQTMPEYLTSSWALTESQSPNLDQHFSEWVLLRTRGERPFKKNKDSKVKNLRDISLGNTGGPCFQKSVSYHSGVTKDLHQYPFQEDFALWRGRKHTEGPALDLQQWSGRDGSSHTLWGHASTSAASALWGHAGTLAPSALQGHAGTSAPSALWGHAGTSASRAL